MHRLFFLPQLRGVPLPSRILCGRSPPGSWKGRRPDQDAVEDPAPESWPTAAGADQAAQAAAGRLRAPGESLCHYGHSQEDESGSGRLRQSRIHAGKLEGFRRDRKARPLRGSLSCRGSTLPGRRPAAAGADQTAQTVYYSFRQHINCLFFPLWTKLHKQGNYFPHFR